MRITEKQLNKSFEDIEKSLFIMNNELPQPLFNKKVKNLFFSDYDGFLFTEEGFNLFKSFLSKCNENSFVISGGPLSKPEYLPRQQFDLSTPHNDFSLEIQDWKDKYKNLSTYAGGIYIFCERIYFYGVNNKWAIIADRYYSFFIILVEDEIKLLFESIFVEHLYSSVDVLKYFTNIYKDEKNLLEIFKNNYLTQHLVEHPPK